MPRPWPNLAVICFIAGCGTATAGSAAPGAAPHDVEASLRAILVSLPKPDATACVAIVGGPGDHRRRDPSPGLVAALAGPRTVVAASNCPRTYASMVRPIDSTGRPSASERPDGYEDPYILEVTRPDAAPSPASAVEITVWKGTEFTGYRCAREPAGGAVRCTVVARGFS